MTDQVTAEAPILLGWGWTVQERLHHAIFGGGPRPAGPGSMYEVALRAFARLVRAESDQDLAASLNSLKAPLRTLRRGYMDDVVHVRYERGLELAYLLAYVPASIRMAEQVIVRSLAPEDIGRTFRVGVVGAGPAPEAVAIVNLLSSKVTTCSDIELHLFDVAADAWGDVRRSLLEVGCLERWEGGIEVRVHELDLREPRAFEPHQMVVQHLDFALVQNCLNEEVAHESASMDNLHDLTTRLSPGAVLAVADQHRYQFVRDRLRTLEHQLEHEVDIFGHFDALLTSWVRDPIPELLVAELLTGEDGLMPRKNLKFGVLGIRVPERPTSLRGRLSRLNARRGRHWADPPIGRFPRWRPGDGATRHELDGDEVVGL